MEEHDLLTYASAIAFQVMTSLIPLALLTLSIMGFLQLEDLWTDDLGTQFEKQVSKEVFAVADDVVRKTLSEKQVFWLTLGAVFTVWQLSGAVRAIMGALSSVYGGGEDRSFRRRYLTSFALGIAVTALVLLAIAIVRFGSAVVGIDDPGFAVAAVLFVVRWGLALVLLSTAVWLLLRYAPARPGPTGWISFGSGVCVIAWIGTSLVFGFYATSIADYGSIFGSLATVFVLFTYLYISSCAFLIGVQLDAIVRKDNTGSKAGSQRPDVQAAGPIVARREG